MVGLSIVLETQKNNSNAGGVISLKTPQVLSKTAMLITTTISTTYNRSASHRGSCFSESYFPSTAFLEHCFLCKQRLLPGKDIYMYKGDRAFCSLECRSRLMFMDEEESLQKGNCSLVVVRKTPHSSSSSSSSPPSPSFSAGYTHQRGGPRNGAGGFAY